ncbi:hypothetical protein [Clostridium tyrobutyricum]|uniref:hypothetical protein n=1 Tax=Clostridium tyrobutyricum TaxID=1519 RepID=UPI0010AB4123|nr:hypothetical protein [Clostridium tyrobutyricum]QCH27956.1 hypothetical protein EZN00_01557 [Clostridium tyrobutyricum]
MILQERIEELGSGILTIDNSKVTLIGFTCPERLNDYYIKNIQCFFSMGVYDLEPLDFSFINDDTLFIVNDKNANKTFKYQFELLKKDTVKYKNENKFLSKVYKIRKCTYTHKYNYKDAEISLLFDTKKDLIKYFKNRFNNDLTF